MLIFIKMFNFYRRNTEVMHNHVFSIILFIWTFIHGYDFIIWLWNILINESGNYTQNDMQRLLN